MSLCRWVSLNPVVPVAPSLFLREFQDFDPFYLDFFESVLLQRLPHSCLVVGSPVAYKLDGSERPGLRLQLSCVECLPVIFRSSACRKARQFSQRWRWRWRRDIAIEITGQGREKQTAGGLLLHGSGYIQRGVFRCWGWSFRRWRGCWGGERAGEGGE